MKPKWAVFCDVDDMGFPESCVVLFETQEEAVAWAASQIVLHDSTCSYNPPTKEWSIGFETYSDPSAFLADWQDSLAPMEYLHVYPVHTPSEQAS